MAVALAPRLRCDQLRTAVRLCATSHAFPPLWIAASGERTRFQLPPDPAAFVSVSLTWDETTLFDVWAEFRRLYHAGEVG